MKLLPASINLRARDWSVICLSLLLAGCASVKVTPQRIQPPDPAVAANAIYAEPTPPAQVVVRDFDFSDSAVTENRAPLHRTVDVFRRSSADARREEIGRRAAAVLAEQTAKRLNKLGLHAVHVASGNDLSMSGNFLLMTGRLIEVDEGNRLTRVAIGLGAGKSRLQAEVHAYRVLNGEKAEVLAFTTSADSGRMPGMLASMGAGELLLGPISMIDAAQDAVSSGQKIYSSQVDYLAGQTSDQVARYLSQYAAAEGWIPKSKAKRVHLAS